MTEFEQAKLIADRLLDRPYFDPDCDENIVSRQFIRASEKLNDLIVGNSLKGALIEKLEQQLTRANEVIKALEEALEELATQEYPNIGFRMTAAKNGLAKAKQLQES